MNNVKVSGVVITYNEQRNIHDCLESMKPIVDELVVIDSFSTDNTVSIAENAGARVIQHPFAGHIEQKNVAMKEAHYDIILSLDADERVSEAMAASIKQIKANWVGNAYSFNRLNNYCGAWLKRSWYPDRKLRLWDRTYGEWGGTNPHDKVIVQHGVRTLKLKGDILHYAYDNLEEHFEQVKKFAIIAANSKYQKGKKVNFVIHLIFNPFYKFFRKYILRLGFLDGYYGFIFSAVTAYLNFLKYARLWELNRKKK